MSTQETPKPLAQQDRYPGAEGWPQPSSKEIDNQVASVRNAPESAEGKEAALWLAREAWHSWYGRHEATWIKTLVALDDLLNRSIEWCLTNAPKDAIGITGYLARYWFLKNGYDVGLPFLKRALDGPFEVSRDRARAMSGVVDAGLAMAWIMPADTVQMAEDTIAMYRCAEDKWGEAHATWHLGLAFCYGSRPKSAMECYWNALTMFREIGDPIGQANVLLCIASLPYYETPIAMTYGPADLEPLTECLRLFKSIGNEWGQGVALTMLLSQKGNLSAPQKEVVQTALLQRASSRWAEWDHTAALEATRLADELNRKRSY